METTLSGVYYQRTLRKDGTTTTTKGDILSRKSPTSRSAVVKTPYSETFRPPTPYKALSFGASPVGSTLVETNRPGNLSSNVSRVSTYTCYNGVLNFNLYPSAIIDIYGNLKWDSRDLLMAENRAIRRIADKKIEAGEYLLEARKSIGMIAKRSGQFLRLALAIRKGEWNTARKLLGLSGKHVRSSKRFADNYLEYSFGWAPIANDIYNSQSTLRALLKKKQQFHVRATEISYVPFDRTVPLEGSASKWSTDLLERTTRVSLWGSPKSDFLSILGVLGVDNPISVLWNAVPFSFVVDWILPVGDLLDATTAPVGTDFLGGTCSMKITGRARLSTRTASNYDTIEGAVILGMDPNFYERKVYNSYPWGMPLYIKNPFSLGKSVTALALVRQLS